MVTFGLQISVQFLSDSCFLLKSISSFFLFSINVCGWIRVDCILWASKNRACTMHEQWRVRRGHTGGKNIYAGMRTKLLWRAINWSKPRNHPMNQSSSQSRRGLGRQDMRIIQEYCLTTTVTIWLLNQPHTCERGSSSFLATIRIKFVSTTSASFPSVPSTER